MSRGQRIGLIALLGLYTALSLLLWAGRPAESNFDSYRYLGDWGWQLWSILDPLNGGFATSLLYVIVPDQTAIGAIQVLIAVAAWGFLAFAIVRRLTGAWVGWLLAILVLTISLHSVFWSSHVALASESLAFSAAVFWLGAVVFLAGSGKPGGLALTLLTVGIAAIAITRPQAMLVLVPAQVVVLLWWTRRERRFTGLYAALPLLLAITAWSLFRVYQVSQHDRWPFRYALHNLVDKEPSFRAYVLERMPACEPIPAALNGPQPWNDVLALDNAMINLCPETYVWFRSDATSTLTWISEIPFQALSNFFQVVPSLTLVRWTDAKALPTMIDEGVLPSLNPWPFIIVALALGIAAMALSGAKPRVTVLSALGTIVAVVAALAYVFAVWAADGVDFGRHVYPIIPLIGVAALVLPATMPQRISRDRSSA